MKKSLSTLILTVVTLGVFYAPTQVKAAVYINEIMATNVGQFLDPTFNYTGWIELYNDGDADVNIRFWRLSDDAANKNKYRVPYDPHSVVPARGYLVIWCENYDLRALSTNFKLDCDGGTLYFSNMTDLVDSVAFPEQIKGASYARMTDGGARWQYCATPSPGRSNAGSTFTANRCPEPTLKRSDNSESAYFSGNISITATVPIGMTLRYTTDGSEPTAQSATWTTQNIQQTTTLRARLFGNNRIPGPTVTHTYIRQTRDYTLPVLSLVGNPDYFWGDSIGIYVSGVNGKPGNGSGGNRNWNQDWARPINVEFIDPYTGEPFYETEADVSITGGWSRGWAQKSLDLSAEKKYEGKNRFEHTFFVSKPNIRLKHLLLRNSGNDASSQGGMQMEDALSQTLVEDVLDVEHQAYQPVIHYINGEYYGIINMRERNNKQYVYSNFGWDDTEIDQFEINPTQGYVQMCGTETEWNKLVNYSASAASASQYTNIKKMLDIEEFINYMAVEMYIGNWDWPQNNVKGFRHKKDGKFRFTLYDLEGGVEVREVNKNSFTEVQNKQTYTFDSDPNNEGAQLTAEIKLVTLWLNLLKNAEFKKRFVDKYCMLAGSVFAPERVNTIADSLANNIQAELIYHQQRWGGNFNGGLNNYKNFMRNRPTPALNTLKSYMQLTNDPIQVSISSAHPAGFLFVNEQEVPTNQFSGKLFPPVTLRAEVPAGYEFVGWRETENTQTEETTIFALGSQWNYYESALTGQDWTALSFNSNSWGQGRAPLGYRGGAPFNNGKEVATQINKGNPTRITTYFRRSFNITEAVQGEDIYTLSGEVDDGAVFYVNGTEVGRYLMPTGQITSTTQSSTHAASNPDPFSITVPSNLLRQGNNVVAIEVHQTNATSSDIYIDAQLIRSRVIGGETGGMYSTDIEVSLPATGEYSLRAVYKQIANPELRPRPVRINEVSASNYLYQNEYNKLEDWIELYNTTGQPIDLAGMYLTDTWNDRTKYQFPAGKPELTVIPAYGHKIVWCDKEGDITQLHANFKLAGEKGWVYISEGTEGNILWSDSICYRQHDGAVSVGRYPDGSDDVYLFNRPSISKVNMYSIYSTEVAQDVGVGIYSPEADNFAPKTLIAYYVDTRELHLTLPTDDYNPATVSILTASGQLVEQKTSISSYDRTIPVGQLATGWYIAIVRLTNGEQGICKFFVP